MMDGAQQGRSVGACLMGGKEKQVEIIVCLSKVGGRTLGKIRV